MYTLKGEIKVIQDLQQISDSFKKREFVVTDSSGKYSQDILFQLTQDRCESINQFKQGDAVEVTFFLRGREWENPKTNEVRYFNSLDAWKVEAIEFTDRVDVTGVAEEVADDDLPF